MSDNNSEVKLIFKADESGALAAMNKYSAGLKRMDSDTSNLVTSIKSHWVGISAGVASAAIAISKGWDYAKLGAAALQTEDAFRNVAKSAGISADATIDAMKRMTADTIDDSDLMQKSLKGLTQGLSGDDMIKIAEIARVAARTSGTGVAEAFSEITDAIANNTPRALKRFGLVADEEMDRLSGKAKEGTKNVDLLGVAYDRTKEKIIQMGGALQDTPSEWMQQQEKNIGELKESIGKIFIAAGGITNSILKAPGNAAVGAYKSLERLVGIDPDQIKKEIDATNRELERLDTLGQPAKKTPEDLDLERRKLGLEGTKEGLEEIKKQITSTTKAFAEMGSVISSMGGVKLGFAGDDFKKAINQQADDLQKFTTQYQNLSDTVKSGIDLDRQISRVDDLTSSFSKYGEVIDDVYRAQIDQQQEILDEMRNYEKSQANIAKQAANITETEIKYNATKLSSYQSLYSELKKLQKEYYDAAVKATQDIANIEKSMITDLQDTGNLVYDAWNKANPANNELEQYYRDITRLDQETTAAMSLSGDERIQKLKSIQSSYAALSKQITTTEEASSKSALDSGFSQAANDVWSANSGSSGGSSQIVNTFDEVKAKIIAVGSAISQTKDQMIAEATAVRDQAAAAYTALVNPIETVKSAIVNTQSAIIRLDELLTQQRAISIDTSGALSSVQLLIDKMNTLSGFSMLQITGGSSSTAAVASSDLSFSSASEKVWNNNSGTNWDGSQQVTYYPLDSFASGTNYVPRTGLYQLHQGEGVTSARENKNASPKSVTVNLGGIVINSNVSNPKAFAKKIALDVEKEISRLDYMRS